MQPCSLQGARSLNYGLGEGLQMARVRMCMLSCIELRGSSLTLEIAERSRAASKSARTALRGMPAPDAFRMQLLYLAYGAYDKA